MTKKQYSRGRDLTELMDYYDERIRRLKREKQRMSSAFLHIGFEQISVPNECREEIVDLLLDCYRAKRKAAKQEFEKL